MYSYASYYFPQGDMRTVTIHCIVQVLFIEMTIIHNIMELTVFSANQARVISLQLWF